MLKFGTLGAARITPPALIAPCKNDLRASVHVVAARSRPRAEAFATEHGIPNVVDSYQDVIDHPDINAVYVPLPIADHREWTFKALTAGKHVLCEKSFASNASEARDMAEAASKTDRVVMDAFHYRYHPLFRRAKEIYQSGALGEIQEIHAIFHSAITDKSDIRMMYETGGGVTMDIGCYPLSWVRHITGEEPVKVTARAETGPPDIDIYLKAEMVFPGGIKASAEGDMRRGTKYKSSILVIGQKGTMAVSNPIGPQMGHSLDVKIGEGLTCETFDKRPTYSYQLDAFIDAVENGTAVLTGPEDAVKQMELIDRCYEAAGLKLRGL